MNGAYIGPEYHSAEIMRMARRNNAVFEAYSDFEQLYQYVADLLSHGKIIGWFQGRMEYGPRALGSRSILGDPRHPQMQKRLNLKIKYREGFRPFAPSVLEEDIEEYFELNRPSPYMTLVAPVQKKRRNPLPENYTEMGMYERLYHLRSDIPAVTHVDYSARIQSVSKKTNPKYWALINAFKDKTGYGLLVNTSFNVRGEPIVCTPDDAYKCFMRTEMDYLVANNYIFDKLKQPEWIQSDDWKEEFSKD
jgi:carbamoyltransferase